MIPMLSLFVITLRISVWIITLSSIFLAFAGISLSVAQLFKFKKSRGMMAAMGCGGAAFAVPILALLDEKVFQFN